LSLLGAICRFCLDVWINFGDFFNKISLFGCIWVLDDVGRIGLSSFKVYRSEVRRGTSLVWIYD